MAIDHAVSETAEIDVATDEMLVNMGPQHPSTHGVLRLVLRTDGEVVTELTPHIGYLHRCAEKIGENVTPRQFIPYTDRLDYLSSMNMNLGWALAVEKLMALEVTEKARHLRVMMCELNRIGSHLVAACCHALDLGSFTPFMWAFREREKIQNLFEEVCGARLTYSYITVGGVMYDLPQGWLEKCEAFLDQFEPCIDELHALLTGNAIFIRRTAGIGVLAPAVAIDYGCTGPVLRGSGVDWDLRRDGQPWYTRMYDGYQFEVIAETAGRYPRDEDYPPVPKAAVLGDSWHLPTLAGAVGFKDFNPTNLDGANQWNFLIGQTNQAIQTNHIIHGSMVEAYYKDNWKLIISTDGPQELYQIAGDPTETNNVIAQNATVAATLFKEYEAFPRGELVDDPYWKILMDMDKFGGTENRLPYAGLEGVNAGPLHPIYYIIPLFFLSIIGLIWWRRNRKRKKFQTS